jgi:hypothetical protein
MRFVSIRWPWPGQCAPVVVGIVFFLEEFVLGSAKKKAEKLEERLAQARQWMVGARQILERVNRESREFIDEADRRLLEAATEDECNRIIEQAEIYERRMGAVGAHLSPYRSDSLLSQWRREKSGQLEMFDDEGAEQ